MIRTAGALLAIVVSAVTGASGQSGCGSFRASATPSPLDLSPLPGYVEVCSRDRELCRQLTNGFPPSTVTLGYFVSAEDWQARAGASRSGFHDYLIAQLAQGMTADDLPRFKQYLRSQNGTVPDHTELPKILASEGRAPLGIFHEDDHSISFGTVMKLRRTDQEAGSEMPLVATNSMAVVNGAVLSLYVYTTYRTDADVTAAQGRTTAWLACLERQNRNRSAPR
jgi:hypothetical protein